MISSKKSFSSQIITSHKIKNQNERQKYREILARVSSEQISLKIIRLSYITFVIDSPLMMGQSRAESTRDTYNYRQYLNQFPPNTIKVIREFERIQEKICRHKMSIMFNEICIYIYIYILKKLPQEISLKLFHSGLPRLFRSTNYCNCLVYLNMMSQKSLFCMLISKVSEVVSLLVEGDPKTPFSIATTPRCKGGRYSIPWIDPLYP